MNDLYTIIGQRVRSARKRTGMSQEDIAKRVGFLRTSVVNIEQGRQRVPLHTLVKVADALGVTVGDLLPPSFLPVGDAREVGELEEKIADLKAMLQEVIEEMGDY